jgi:hypothetical protein
VIGPVYRVLWLDWIEIRFPKAREYPRCNRATWLSRLKGKHVHYRSNAYLFSILHWALCRVCLDSAVDVPN